MYDFYHDEVCPSRSPTLDHIFLDKGAIAPASASIDAHGLFIKKTRSLKYKYDSHMKYSHKPDMVAT
jgi:hypothetical protein